MTHTPGPWHKVEADTTIPIKAANGKTVASVRYSDNDDNDANLIAAAPDLLAALEAIMKGVSGCQKEPQYEAARAAIAKAKGATA